MVLCQAINHLFESNNSAGCDDPRLPHSPAEPFPTPVGLGDEIS
jgi:hypothetical protein